MARDGLIVHCAKCDYEWTIAMKMPIAISRFVGGMRGAVRLGCPKCGAHGRDVLVGPAKEADAVTMDLGVRVRVKGQADRGK